MPSEILIIVWLNCLLSANGYSVTGEFFKTAVAS